MPLGARIYQGWVGAVSKLKSSPIEIRAPRGAAARKRDWSHGRGSVYTKIPPITDTAIQEIGFYSVVEPFSYTRATYNSTISEYILTNIEPTLTEDEEELLKLIKETLEKTLEYEWDKLAVMDNKTFLERSVDSFIKSRGMSIEPISKDKITYFISRDFVGYGKIDALMNDKNIEDVSCDGVGIPLFVFHNKFESIKTNVSFEDEDDLNSFVINLGQRCGKQLSVSNPILDGTTPEGHRVQATYAREVTTRGASFTIRRFKEKPFTPVELIKYGTASPEIVAYLWLSVEHGESAIICGGTASGKTATLNAMALFIPPGAKVVTMEDTREINLPHENWIPGTTRSGVGERGPDGKAAGEIDMYDLVRAALRQRPNYIIVGEVRGKETYTMFQAMATGHTTFSTMHADSVKGMVNRLENPPINCPRILLTALRNVIIQTHARVGMGMVRRIKQLIEIVGFEPETNELISNTVYEWDQASDKFIFKGHSFLFDKIMEMKNLTHEELTQEFERRVDIVKYMVAKDIADHREIWGLIREYYKDPKATAEMVRKELHGAAPRPAQVVVSGGEATA
ncbi:MAG: type II/IV secretion system ATPase subunit [Candidatus Thermoplasmatota archaeon]|nr:type II/IV secretion system ATPase subunit [Candidatus Thermoplasmatota archaeon]MBU1913883.1 type II/IV secretion system ATPase subunit [Candidatus Thermoplasmatota archaeon]